jgi:hypothetical protein
MDFNLVAARSKARFCRPSLTGITGLNPNGSWMSILCAVFLCDRPIHHPELSYREYLCLCLIEYDLVASKKAG